MSLRQKAGKISRRSKQASIDTVTSASASHARENSANRSDGKFDYNIGSVKSIRLFIVETSVRHMLGDGKVI